jgi:hypothetical protein
LKLFANNFKATFPDREGKGVGRCITVLIGSNAELHNPGWSHTRLFNLLHKLKIHPLPPRGLGGNCVACMVEVIWNCVGRFYNMP